MAKIDRVEAVVSSLGPLAAFVPVIGQALPIALAIIKQYRAVRDALEVEQPGKSGMLSDSDLFDLLQQDAKKLEDHAASLIAQWSPKEKM